MPQPFAVIVTFEVDPARHNAFDDLIRDNARTSLEVEAGCFRFDIVTGADGRIHLYEVYADSDAFGEHLKSSHFLAFEAATAPIVRSKAVITGPVIVGEKLSG